MEVGVENQIKQIISKYKDYVRDNRLQNEIYKWHLVKKFKGRPNYENPNLLEELKSIDFSNLVYHIGVRVIHHIAAEVPEDYRKSFELLFNEEDPLQNRILKFNESTLKIYRTLVSEKKHSHHQDERTMATFLTYRNPEKYAFYKESVYRRFCQLLKLKPQKKGYKYTHYLQLLEDFILKYISTDSELLDLVDSCMDENCFEDRNRLLLAQDILYQSIDQLRIFERNYWRVGTGDNENNYWEEMKNGKYVAIGWNDLGDLSDLDKKPDFVRRMKKNGYGKEYSSNVLSRKAGEIFNFCKSIEINDVVIAQKGESILGVGVVKEEYGYNIDYPYAHFRGVDWYDLDSLKLSNRQGLQTSVYQISDIPIISTIDRFFEGNPRNDKNYPKLIMSKRHPLNQIFYGPPGTGKTYQSKSVALEIISGQSTINRKFINEEYQKLVKSGRIGFVTFHQSMTYEDFMEGIKPRLNPDENEELSYELVDGIFKRLCIEASYEYIKLQTENQSFSKVLTFSQLYDELLNDFQEKIENEEEVIISTKSGGNIEVIEITAQNNFRLQHRGGKRHYTVSKTRLSKLFDAIEDFDSIPNIHSYFRTIIGGNNASAYWSILNQIFQKSKSRSLKTNVYSSEADYETKREAFEKINWNEINKDASVANYVLIIDEINRGNIAAIFGELITLLESDKRSGEDEYLETLLPYSKSNFSVPPNLYLIGTMNTADRSVEALDTALRRRFSFKEYLPNPKLLKGLGQRLLFNLLRKYARLGWHEERWIEIETSLKGIILNPNTYEEEKENLNLRLKESNFNESVLSNYFNSSQIQFIDFEKMLYAINWRIEKLLNKDYTIGHAYFINLVNSENPIEDLRSIFSDKVIPLLQEYFYGNYDKIELVIGHQFFIQIQEEIGFMRKNEISDNYSEKKIFRLKNISSEEEIDNQTFIKALKEIYC